MKFSIKSKISLIITGASIFIALIVTSVSIKILKNISEGNEAVDVIRFIENAIDVLGTNLVVLSVVMVLISFALAIVLSTRISRNVRQVNKGLSLLEQGLMPEKIEVHTSDEIGELAERVNAITRNLKETAEFAHEIGLGKYNSSFRPLSDQDVLRNSLINMTTALSEADKRENERAWVINNIAEIGNILRNSGSLENLSDSIIKFLVGITGAVQGALYVAGTNDNGRASIQMTSAYAYNRKKFIQREFEFGEGLTGQAAIEQTSILRTEVPDNYFSITSGILGDVKPSCIFICPLISDEKVFGVLEIAGLKRFTKNEIKLVEEAGPIIARTIFNIQVSESTQKHLKESNRMSSELQVQQEELRQNAEEMQATQEELQKSNENLEVQIEEVSRAQRRMQSLLENASEVITIYEKDRKIKYVSPSVKNILGYEADDLLNEDGVVRVYGEDTSVFVEAFDSLLSNPSLTINIQIRFCISGNEQIWLEAIGKNMLDDKSILGIVFNYRDITLKRKAEIEERMRRNMQALSENSPDLITRISEDGRIIYTNPTIETYTDAKPSEFINHSLDELHIGNGFLNSWKEMLEVVKLEKNKVCKELKFHSQLGERIMQVNAIPEYNDGVMESVLVVSHDITEQKIIELEVKEKNKNINESINYSKRIQNAIMPDNNVIKSVLPESFIFYKPKDVVSGDFPWFKSNGDTIYIAAVDCTGHGVPGAMLSLVGYFQLNNIVEGNSALDPGKILDLLDEKVNSTLIKSGNEENIKDGMDIAFCKIDKKNKVLEFAGAHRPLYYMTKDGIQELKGNRWAIGGGTYKNQSTFTNYKLDVKKGESVFFFSDGLPDQFGGPENRKFSSTKIKSILEQNQKLSMDKLAAVFDKEFAAWKGDGKQTDDVLMIGIKF
jgi:PAS domain S-box-containing protein